MSVTISSAGLNELILLIHHRLGSLLCLPEDARKAVAEVTEKARQVASEAGLTFGETSSPANAATTATTTAQTSAATTTAGQAQKKTNDTSVKRRRKRTTQKFCQVQSYVIIRDFSLCN